MKNQIITILFLLAAFCAAPVFAQEKSDARNECERYITDEVIYADVIVEFAETDIRDVLQDFNKHFGCEFQLDESIGYVPINIKLENVSWANALQKILFSVNLDMLPRWEKNETENTEKMFLFISTKEKILQEKEKINPVYTESIKLKNLPICPKNTDCEQTSIAFNRLKKIILRRLSRRGGIEYDVRTQTLIITDERANLDSILRVVEFIDNLDFYNKTEEDK